MKNAEIQYRQRRMFLHYASFCNPQSEIGNRQCFA